MTKPAKQFRRNEKIIRLPQFDLKSRVKLFLSSFEIVYAAEAMIG